MPKETFYFTHDYNARNDDKILELRSHYGAEGYGIFWMIAESMAENSDGGIKKSFIGGLSLGYGVAKGWLQEFIDYCIRIGLFYEKDDIYFSKRMLSHKDHRKKLSEYGKSGAAKKWGGYSSPNANKIKGKEIKGISFNEEKSAVNLSDGTIQELGKFQKMRILQDDIKPEEIFKGQIS